ncbi:hypothetical protein JL721_11287 [Aureococcus anophagefferens]|nr:hypothetical protein JL721_11287 [Aureococcus anophagefferens]
MPADRRVAALDSGEALADRLWAHATRRRPDAVKEENRFAFQTAALIFEAAAEELGESDAAFRRRRRACLPGRLRRGRRGVARVDEAAVVRVVDALGPALHAGGGLLSSRAGRAPLSGAAALPHGDCTAIVNLVQRRAAEDGASAAAYLGLGCQLLRRQSETSDACLPLLVELSTDPRFLESDEARRDGGEAVDARAVLNDAVAGLDGDGGDGAVGRRPRWRGEARAAALNEIRYWDSKRDWGRLRACSSCSTRRSSRFCTRGRRAAAALGRWPPRANGCFKAAGVCDLRGDRAFAYFRDAHASLARVLEALAGEPRPRRRRGVARRAR